MKKRILTRAAGTGTKLLLSLLVLLLALTGCNAPNTPMETTPEETTAEMDATESGTGEFVTDGNETIGDTQQVESLIMPEPHGGYLDEEKLLIVNQIMKDSANNPGFRWFSDEYLYGTYYYGLYGECVVICELGQWGSERLIWVRTEERLYPLEEAVSEGLLTQAEVDEINAYHIAFTDYVIKKIAETRENER